MKISKLVGTVYLIIFGIGIYLMPVGVTDCVRGMVCDLLRPGMHLMRLTKESVSQMGANEQRSETAEDSQIVSDLREELERERERNRALQVRLAQLDEQQLPGRDISASMKRSQRLVLPTLIEVAVLGDTLAEQWRTGKIIDQGAKSGLRENELVLSPRKHKTLIDCGEEIEISPEDALLLGRCVIGKVEHVGRWTSTIQLVTDANYRGRAQLIRETTDGRFVFESQGILKGQGGSLCKLDGIPAEKSVRVTDSVYTGARDGIQATPLYYGQVVEASLGPDDREWTILVKPATLPSNLTTVQVLRTSVNPQRLAAK